MTQFERILRHLKAGRAITPAQAWRRYGCMRLSARIYDLKRAGHNIRTEPHTVRDGTIVARYSLIRTPKVTHGRV